MSPRAAAQPAFVLHQYDWSETSLILELFTRDAGRVAVVAKGAKRPTSQLRAVLLPMQRIQVLLSRPGRGGEGGELQTLRSAEWAGGATLPRGTALFSGYYLNELLLKLLARHDPQPALFDVYGEVLAQLDAGEPVLRAFELRLLAELGWLPDLSLLSATQAPLEPSAYYQLTAEAGLLAAPSAQGLSGAQLITLQAALLHGSLEALAQACAQAAPVLKNTLRALLQYHLGAQPLQSRALMLEVQTLLDP